MVLVATCTAAVTYAYRTTLAAIQGAMALTHEISGDLAIVLSGLYLFNHLGKTWRMKRAKVSRYTGIGVVALWSITALSGVYGQVWPLERGSLLWFLHFFTSVAIILGACFHGLWAYRPRQRSPQESA